VRCPGHTIQFMRFVYAEYIRQVLEFSTHGQIDNLMEIGKHETWSPYLSAGR